MPATSILSRTGENTKNFDARFIVEAEFGSIAVESERDYTSRHNCPEAVIFAGIDLVRIDNGDAVIHVDAADALALAAAIQAVAVDLLETRPREIRRNTPPGEPEFAGIGGGL